MCADISETGAPPALEVLDQKQLATVREIRRELEAYANAERQEKAIVEFVDGQLIPRSIEGLFRVANMYWRGGMAPEKTYKSVEAVAVALATGRRLNLSDLQALAYIAIINGRPCLWGEAIPGLIYKSGKVKLFEEAVEGLGPNGEFTEAAVAVCRMERTDVAGVKVARFGWADAKRAGLTGKDTYQKFPIRMLRWRALSWCSKDTFPDVLLGLDVAEEAMDRVDPAGPTVGGFAQAVETVTKGTLPPPDRVVEPAGKAETVTGTVKARRTAAAPKASEVAPAVTTPPAGSSPGQAAPEGEGTVAAPPAAQEAAPAAQEPAGVTVAIEPTKIEWTDATQHPAAPAAPAATKPQAAPKPAARWASNPKASPADPGYWRAQIGISARRALPSATDHEIEAVVQRIEDASNIPGPGGDKAKASAAFRQVASACRAADFDWSVYASAPD